MIQVCYQPGLSLHHSYGAVATVDHIAGGDGFVVLLSLAASFLDTSHSHPGGKAMDIEAARKLGEGC